MPARKARGLRLWGELHISLGFWCLVPSLTGTVMWFSKRRIRLADSRAPATVIAG